jgi:MFS family permease
MSVIGDLIRGRGGQVIAVAQMAGDAGMIVGPLALGFVSDHAGFTPAFMISTALFMISYLLIFTLKETNTKEKYIQKNEPEL